MPNNKDSATNLESEVKCFLNFYKTYRLKFKLSEGDVPNMAASHYIEQGDVYIARIEAALNETEREPAKSIANLHRGE